jgi:hypothetical protein
MKTFFLPYFILLNIFLATNCASKLNITDYINTNEPLTLTLNESSYKKVQIPVQSEKYMKLMKWAENNTTDWQPTIASYMSKFAHAKSTNINEI